MTVVAVGFVLALVLGSAGLLGGGRALGSSTTLTVIGGDVSARHGAGGQFVAAVDGEVLNAGDAVPTGPDARAVLTYFEGSTVTIEPNTELAIDTATAQGGDTVVQMTQNVGRTWHVVATLVAGGSKYEVRTPASTASVRGTAFEVVTDGTTTTVTTTDVTVINQVPDPDNPGRTIDVPVRAGERHTHERGRPVGGTSSTPEPERKVTITLGEENTIVIDTLGRANGIDRNGRTRLETPGAKLERIDGRLVITLPNIPDGRLQALVRKQGGGEVNMQTVVVDRGQSSTSNGRVSADTATGQGSANI
ncbi:MAG: FecR domain-containing protein, partial [Actinomycetota bacterium]